MMGPYQFVRRVFKILWLAIPRKEFKTGVEKVILAYEA